MPRPLHGPHYCCWRNLEGNHDGSLLLGKKEKAVRWANLLDWWSLTLTSALEQAMDAAEAEGRALL